MKPRIEHHSRAQCRGKKPHSGWVSSIGDIPAEMGKANQLNLLVCEQIPAGLRVGAFRAVGILRFVAEGDLGEVQAERVQGQLFFLFVSAGHRESGDQYVLELDLQVFRLRAASAPASDRSFWKVLTACARLHQLGGRGVNVFLKREFMKLSFSYATALADGRRSARLRYAKAEAHKVDFALMFVILRFSLDVAELQEKIRVTRHTRHFCFCRVRWHLYVLLTFELFKNVLPTDSAGRRCEPVPNETRSRPQNRYCGATTSRAAAVPRPTAAKPSVRPTGSAAAGRQSLDTRQACREFRSLQFWLREAGTSPWWRHSPDRRR